MMIGRVAGTTRVLGKSQGYLGLPVRDEVAFDPATGSETPCMVTAWVPTEEEVSRLVAGASVHVRVLGGSHPPMLVEVGEVPE